VARLACDMFQYFLSSVFSLATFHMSIKKISIIGSGNVGSNIAFLLLAKKLAEEIDLIDIRPGLAKGIALDLEDCRSFFKSNISIRGRDNLNLLKPSDIVVITAGKPRSPGMKREDLIRINSGILGEISKSIKKFSPEALVIVVTNPLDLMTYLVLKMTGFSSKRVLGMGSGLDSSRLANIIHKRLNLSFESINPVVFSAHGKDMLVSNLTTAAGVPLKEYFTGKEAKKIKDLTVSRGAEIVGELKTGSARFAPASACTDLIESIAEDKRKLSFVSVYLDGEYGLKNICIGAPVVIGAKGAEEIIEFELPLKEKKMLKKTGESFRRQSAILNNA